MPRRRKRKSRPSRRLSLLQRRRLALAIRRYWRSVKAGRKYRRGYTERHVRPRQRRAKKAAAIRAAKKRRPAPKRAPARKPAKRAAAPPSPWVSFREYERIVNARVKPYVRQWVPHPAMFNVKWVYLPLLWGSNVRRLPRGVVRRRAFRLYFLVKGYSGFESPWFVTSWPFFEGAHEVIEARTLSEWRALADEVWETYIADEVKARHGRWRQVARAPQQAIVLFHFLKHHDEREG